MLLKTTGIVFRCMKYSETSVICDIYTREKGLLSFIISGVRKKNAKTHASLLQIMSLVELVAYVSDKKKLHRIKEVKAAHIYISIPFQIQKSAVGQFMTEICKNAIREPEKNEELFDFIFRCFVKLDQIKSSISIFHHIFMLKLSAYLGFSPNLNYSNSKATFNLREGQFEASKDLMDCLDRENSAMLFELLNADLEDSYSIKIPKVNRQTLLNGIIKYYQYHIENFKTIQSHSILHDVLE